MRKKILASLSLALLFLTGIQTLTYAQFTCPNQIEADCGNRLSTSTSFVDGTAIFTINDTEGYGGLSFVWYKLSGVNTCTGIGQFSPSIGVPRDNSQYRCVVSVGSLICNYFDFAATAPPPPPAPQPVNAHVVACGGPQSVLSIVPSSNYSYTWQETATGQTLQQGPMGYLSTGHAYVLTSSSLTVYHSDGPLSFNFTVTNTVGSQSSSTNMSLTVLGPLSPLNPTGTVKICTTCTQTITAQYSGDQTYEWRKNGVPMQGQTSHILSNATPGTYVLYVTAYGCSRSTPPVNIIRNIAPVANAGYDHTTYFSMVSTGSGTDSDGYITAYHWQQITGPGVTINDPSAQTLRVDNAPPGTYVFRLTVTDETGDTGYDEITIIKKHESEYCNAPLATCAPRDLRTTKAPYCSDTPTSFTFTIEDHEGNGGGLSYTWYRRLTFGCELLVGQLGNSFTTPVIQAGQVESYVCRVSVGSQECFAFDFTASLISTPPPIPVVNNQVIACGQGISELEVIGQGNYEWSGVGIGTIPPNEIVPLPNGQGHIVLQGSALTIHHSAEQQSWNFTVREVLTGQCAIGATASLSFTVVENQVVINAEDETRCGDGTVILSASGTSLSDFKWYDIEPASGTTPWKTGPEVTSHQLSTSKTYWVTAKDQYGCVGVEEVEAVVVQAPPLPVIANIEQCAWEPVDITPLNEVVVNWYLAGSTQALQAKSGTLRLPPFGSTGQFQYEAESIGTAGCNSTRVSFTINVPDDCDHRLNWIEQTTYDQNTAVVAGARAYFDDTGSVLQSQSKSLSGNKVMATQSLYDRYDRIVGSTLPAPLTTSAFRYNFKFNSGATGGPYDYLDFDNPEGSNTVIHPVAVSKNIPGTVGWYYSDQNTWEQHVPVTGYPYSRTEYYEDGTGEIKRSASQGDSHRLGSGHEIWTATFPVFAELTDYLSKRSLALPGITQDGNLANEAAQTVVRDENGKFSISITDKSGKAVMSCRAGTVDDNVLTVINTVTSSGDPTSAHYRPLTYFYLLNDQPVTISGSTDFIVENLITNERKNPGVTFAGVGGNWSAGFYRVLLSNTSSSITLNYTHYFLDVSYQFYDDAGRLKTSVSPNGYKQWIFSTAYDNIDKTTYSYNHRGWLLTLQEPDAGKTRYVYRRDGTIRFSQNAEQKRKNHFSYTHYDSAGRPVESGEYIGTTLAFIPMDSAAFGASDMEDELEKTFDQVNWDTHVRKDWVVTHYGAKTSSIPDLPASFQQEFILGAVSSTENADMRTWYSYDEQGRVTWVARRPAEFKMTFVTQYTYDFLGNVLTTVNTTYKKRMPANSFYHHYEYDADKRLSRVLTSIDGSDKNLRATYEYYLHGPLKRIELGDQIQGIDFVYNINGWLTQINHPDKAQDPGGDPNDAFGMVLDYYESAMNGLFQASVNDTRDKELFRIHHLPILEEHIQENLALWSAQRDSPQKSLYEGYRSLRMQYENAQIKSGHDQ